MDVLDEEKDSDYEKQGEAQGQEYLNEHSMFRVDWPVRNSLNWREKVPFMTSADGGRSNKKNVPFMASAEGGRSNKKNVPFMASADGGRINKKFEGRLLRAKGRGWAH